MRDVDEYNRRYDAKDNEFAMEDDTLYVKEKQIQRSNNKLSSIKLNASVFKSLLNEQPQYDIDKNTGILLGNRDAKEWITIISNHIVLLAQNYISK